MEHNTRIGTRAICAVSALLLAVWSMLSVPSAYAANMSDTFLSGKPVSEYGDFDVNTMPQISATSFACLDSDGNVYAQCHGADRVKIASTTKIMTAIIASESPLGMKVTVSEQAASVTGSGAGVQAGDVIDLYELIEGLMLPSGNDAAYAIAEALGGELLIADGAGADASYEQKVERFVAEMNARAQNMGLADTLFANPCGLDDEGFEGPHCSSAVDVAKMTAAAMKVPVIAEICGEYYGEMLSRRGEETVPTPMYNTNQLLVEGVDSVGTKTGYTDAAGGCFAGAYSVNGDMYYIAVLGCASTRLAMDESEALWQWSRDNRVVQNAVPDAKTSLATLAAPGWADKSYEAVVEEPFVHRFWTWEEPYSFKVKLDVPEEGAIERGSKLGEVEVAESSGKEVKVLPIVADRTVRAPNAIELVGASVERLYAASHNGEGVVRNVEHPLATEPVRVYARADEAVALEEAPAEEQQAQVSASSQ